MKTPLSIIPKRMPTPFCLVLAVLLAHLATTATACDACNLAFARRLQAEGDSSPNGRDFRNILDNQRGLALAGLGASPQLVAMIEGETPAGASAAAAPMPPPSPAPSPVAAPASPVPPPASPITVLRSADDPPAQRLMPEWVAGSEFEDIHRRDQMLSLPPTSAVPQDLTPDKQVSINLHEGQVYLGNGVIYDGFVVNGKIPGPTIIVEEGDIVEFTVHNKGTIAHGASIHAAYTQTSKYLGKILPGQSRKVVFQVNMPGIYMYHCAPGGHAIPMHVLFGQYGMMVVKPKERKYRLEEELGRPPDCEIYMIQHELYASGKSAIEGKAAYMMFNGKLFRYVEEPIKVRPGDYVRINFLNVGPNLLSTFHIVGIIWDYAYWQGNPDVCFPGGQSVNAGPTDSWVIEFRVPPDEGAYTILNHSVGSTSRGAIGLIVAEKDAVPEPVILAEGPVFTEEEMAENIAQAKRTISPFKPATHPEDAPVVFGSETTDVRISIIGNSFHPKVVQVAPGTRVTWSNEDAFTYLSGEFAGVHNAACMSAPDGVDGFVSPLLAHGETFTHEFAANEGEYEYMCTPHPYMKGKVVVKQADYSLAQAGAAGGPVNTAGLSAWVLAAVGICFLLSLVALLRRSAARA